MTIRVIVSIVLIFITILGCKRKGDYVLPPTFGITFLIQEGGERLPDSTLRQIKVHYYEDNTKKALETEVDSLADFLSGQGFMFIERITLVSAQNGVKDFYIIFPDGSTDTLYLNAETVSIKEGSKERCYCTDPIREVQYNGKSVTEHELSWKYGKPYYVCERNR